MHGSHHNEEIAEIYSHNFSKKKKIVKATFLLKKLVES